MIDKRLALAAAFIFATAAVTPVAAQRAAPVAVARGAALQLTTAQQQAAIASIISAVETKYVFPERLPAIVSRMRAGLTSGRYDLGATRFAEQVTEDLRQASQDRHMYLNYAPAEYAASAVAGGSDSTAALDALYARRTTRANHGLSELRILPGNIRYLRITAFPWMDDRTGAAYDDALRFLRDGDAVIIDLRNNGGGSHAAVRYLLSHFMKPEVLDITFLQAGEPPMQSHTLNHLPAGRIEGKPLYVLVNRQVGSAAEAFAYDVQQFKLGTLVGETTGGAANNNTFVPIAPGFMLSVSYGRPVHPVSGGNWEGVGVTPEIPVKSDKALAKAQTLALTTLMAKSDADPGDRADWAWALPAATASLVPLTVQPARLKQLAGVYSGRIIVLQGDELYWRRKDGQTARLSPMTQDGWFTVDGYDDRFRIRLTGDAMQTQWIDEPEPTVLSRD